MNSIVVYGRLIVVVLGLSLFSLGCGRGDAQKSPQTEKKTVAESKNGPFTLYLSHVNDTHSHFDPALTGWNVPTRGDVPLLVGDYPRIKKQVDFWRSALDEQGQEMLFLHGGDVFGLWLFYS